MRDKWFFHLLSNIDEVSKIALDFLIFVTANVADLKLLGFKKKREV